MIETQIRTAATAARSHADMNGVAKVLWRAHAAGLLDDAAASAVAEVLEARRAAMKAGQAFGTKPTSAAPRRPPRSPDRQASLERRRRCAASGTLPPQIASSFTTGEAAVLAIVVGEVRRRGLCGLYLDAVAALAGVSRSTAKAAIRHARQLGLLTVQERRRRGRKSDSNLIRIVASEWLAWLKLGPRPSADRGQKESLHGYKSLSPKRAGGIEGKAGKSCASPIPQPCPARASSPYGKTWRNRPGT